MFKQQCLEQSDWCLRDRQEGDDVGEKAEASCDVGSLFSGKGANGTEGLLIEVS